MKFRCTAVVVLLLTCAACSTGMDAMVRTAIDAMPGKRDDAGARLDPKFRWIRVVTQGRQVHLALGYEDKDPLGTIEVWYSGTKEVLRLQNGRIAGATGLTTEWRSVSFRAVPTWQLVASAKRPLRWTRLRDVMPGYRFGVSDQLEVRAISAPKGVPLQGLDPQRLSWFEERIVPPENSRGSAPASQDLLPAARYAVDLKGGSTSVVYGEQCLSPGLCFAWQRVTP